MNKILLILAGIDSSGGAGIIADVKTATELGIFSYAIPTLFTNQNSFNFKEKVDIEHTYITETYKTLTEEKRPDFIKIGYIPHNNPTWLKEIKKNIINKADIVVIDPVLKPTSSKNIDLYINDFINFISPENGNKVILTPNKKELENLFKTTSANGTSFEEKAINFTLATNVSLVIKFETEKKIIMIIDNGKKTEVPIEIVKTERDVHGTGCRFSTALISFMIKGFNLTESVKKASEYMTEKIKKNTILLSQNSHLIIY